MKLYYDKEIDYLEIFFKKDVNYGEDLTDDVMVFKSELSDAVVGYAFEDAEKNAPAFAVFNLSIKLAILLKIARTKNGLTQEESAKKIGSLTLRHYQRLESGEGNTTLELFAEIMKAYPNEDFTVIFKNAA